MASKKYTMTGWAGDEQIIVLDNAQCTYDAAGNCNVDHTTLSVGDRIKHHPGLPALEITAIEDV